MENDTLAVRAAPMKAETVSLGVENTSAKDGVPSVPLIERFHDS